MGYNVVHSSSLAPYLSGAHGAMPRFLHGEKERVARERKKREKKME